MGDLDYGAATHDQGAHPRARAVSGNLSRGLRAFACRTYGKLQVEAWARADPDLPVLELPTRRAGRFSVPCSLTAPGSVRSADS